MSPDTFGNLLIVLGSLAGFAFLTLFVLSLIWTYRDAQERGKTGCLWLLIVFFTWPFGWLAYYLLREKEIRL
jgi:uncharacterized membrane protein